MKHNFEINPELSIPKYQQIIDGIIADIKKGYLNVGDRLPSINDFVKDFKLSRDTVVIAYDELKNSGIINSKHGKGYYVASNAIHNKLKIFVLFDVMNGYKEVLYRSLIQNLGTNYQIDIFFHYHNVKVFEQLIINNLNKYGFYIIMPHFNEDISEIVSKIPKEKLLIIDKDIEKLNEGYAAIFQNFEKDVLTNFTTEIKQIKKYTSLKFIANLNFQFIPTGIFNGLKTFCRLNKIKYSISDSFNSIEFNKGDLLFIITDNDLIEAIKSAKSKNYLLGKDVGIISYDDTPMKEILADGITVLSTDFKKMGETAAWMIKNNIRIKNENPCKLIVRKSI